MPTPTNLALILGQLLGTNPPGLARDVRKGFPLGFPTWDVTLFNRNLVVQHTPYFYSPTKGPAVRLTLTHNSSSDAGVTDLFTFPGPDDTQIIGLPCGRRWWLNIQSCIELRCAPEGLNSLQIAIVRMPDLRTDIFIADPNGNPDSDEGQEFKPLIGGIYNKLKRVGANKFELTLQDHSKYEYTWRQLLLSNNAPCYQMTKEINPLGEATQINWSDEEGELWLPTSIEDANGKVTTFLDPVLTEYGKRIETIESPFTTPPAVLDNCTIAYEVDNDRIKTVRNQDSKDCEYEYYATDIDVITEIHMTKSVTVPSPAVVDLDSGFEYDFTGLTPAVNLARDPDGGEREYNPGPESNTLFPSSVVITDERDFETTHHFNFFGGSVEIVDPLSKSTFQAFEGTQRQVRRVIDRQLHVTDLLLDHGAELVDAKVSVPNHSGFNPGTGNFAVMACFRMKPDETGGDLVSHGDAWSITVSASQVTCSINATSMQFDVPTDVVLNDGYDHIVVLTRHEGTMYCAIDGVLFDNPQSETNPADSEDPIVIGSDAFSGRVKKVGVWLTGFSEELVEVLSEGGLGFIMGLVGIVSYWPVDDGEGDTVVDIISGNDGERDEGDWTEEQGAPHGNLIEHTRWADIYSMHGDVEVSLLASMGTSDKIVTTRKFNARDDIEEQIEAAGSTVARKTVFKYDEASEPEYPHNVKAILAFAQASDPESSAIRTEMDYYTASEDGAGRIKQLRQQMSTGITPTFLTTDYTYRASDFAIDTIVTPTDALAFDVDELGRVFSRQNIFGQVTLTEFDKFHRPTLTTMPNGTTTLNTYNEVELESVKDMNDFVKKFWRDNMSRLVGVYEVIQGVDVLVLIITREPNGSGFVYSISDTKTPQGSWIFFWDDLGRLQYRFSPLSPNLDPNNPSAIFSQWTYYDEGELLEIYRDERGIETHFGLDSYYRVDTITAPDSVTLQEHDPLYRLTSTNKEGVFITWDFQDVLGLVVNISTSEGNYAIQNNPLGQRTHLTYPTAQGIQLALTYLYNTGAQLDRIQQDGSTPLDLVVLGYDSFRLTTRTLANGIVSTYGYDDSPSPATSMNRITDIQVTKDSVLLFHLEYPQADFDGNGNIGQMKRTVFPFVDGRFRSGSRAKYNYYPDSALNHEEHFLPTAGDNDPFIDQSNNYDLAGNRTIQNLSYFGAQRIVESTVIDEASQLKQLTTTYPPGSTPFVADMTYYKNGNREKLELASGGGGQEKSKIAYSYNDANNLTEFLLDAWGLKRKVNFGYNGLGLRVEKTVTDYVPTTTEPTEQSKVKTRYLLDGLNVLVETLVTGEAPNEGLTPKAIYVPGVLMAALKETGESDFRFYIPDAQGNVIALSDASGEITRVYQNDAWGNPLITTATNILGISSTLVVQEDLPNPYQWNGMHGYYYDADVGMYLLGLRWYEPFTGRFLTPVPGGIMPDNCGGCGCGCEFEFPYEYSKNNPLNRIDPMGTDSWFWDFIRCWNECVEDNDPVGYAIDAALLALGGPIPKTWVISIANATGDKQLAAKIAQQLAKEGTSKYTTLPSALSAKLRAGGKSSLRALGKYGQAAMVVYGTALAIIEAYCTSYCLINRHYDLKTGKITEQIKELFRK